MTQTANKHGFEVKQEFTMGGIAWTVIQTGEEWVKCITSECVEKREFDRDNKNDFAASDLRAYLNDEFYFRLIKAGAPKEVFEYFKIDLTADDGLKNYGSGCVCVGLITCDEYRALRENIPLLPDTWWWTATPDSPVSSCVRCVDSAGLLSHNDTYHYLGGVRPLCILKSEILASFLNGDAEKRRDAADMMKGYNELATIIHENAVAHGWWEKKRGFPEILALIHSEVSEALEEYRNGREATVIYFGNNGEPEGIPIELADVIIRILDYCGYAGIDIDTAISQKHKYNKSRPYRHGGKEC